MPKQSMALTVYLLVPEISEPLDAVADVPLSDLCGLPPVVPGPEWVLCIRNTPGKRPDWATFFGVDIKKFGFNSSVSALLLVPSGGRVWALTFGHGGRSMLREGIIEDRFGLRTALNAIDPDKVRAIDKETFDSFASQARQQSPADTEFENFGINIDRDLLYAVAGVPRDKRELGPRLAGKDSLCCSIKRSISELPEYLDLLLTYFVSDAYKEDKRFAWIDNIYEIRDKAHRRELDERLVEKLCKPNPTNTWLALPEIIDWQQVSGFSYINPTTNFVVDDLHLSYFLAAFRARKRSPLDLISLKRSKVVCLDHDGEVLKPWSAYRCLYAEIETKSGDVFLLTNGHWYKVDREIVVEVNEWYDALEIDSTMLPSMNVKEHEPEYNNRVGNLPQYRLFHDKKIYLSGNRGGIEFCDLAVFGEAGCDLIHVKRFGRSNKLSHLFYQGTNSARLFRISPAFRKALSLSIEDDQHLAKRLVEEPERREYRVVFAIASSSTSKKLNLPLFSRLSLRQALSELDGLGFRTAVVKIAVPPDERKLKQEKPRKGRAPKKVF